MDFRQGGRVGRLMVVMGVVLLACASWAHAQAQLPPPAGPLLFCGDQATPLADSYQLVFDGGAPEPVALVTPATATPEMQAACTADAAGWTHAFTVAAARFTVRPTPYSVVIRATNAFGATDGPTFSVLIGVAPGTFTIRSVRQLPAD